MVRSFWDLVIFSPLCHSPWIKFNNYEELQALKNYWRGGGTWWLTLPVTCIHPPCFLSPYFADRWHINCKFPIDLHWSLLSYLSPLHMLAFLLSLTTIGAIFIMSQAPGPALLLDSSFESTIQKSPRIAIGYSFLFVQCINLWIPMCVCVSE